MQTKSLHYIFLIILLTAYNLPAQNTWQPFSDDSPWNQKITADAETDPLSQQLIDSLALERGIYINIQDWSVPVYYINSDTVPKVNVINSRPGIYGKSFEEPNQVPVMPGFIASPPVGEYSDNHLCIVDTAKMISWDMWAARKDKNGNWTTGLGAVVDLKSTGVEIPWYEQENEFDAHRSRASGFPLIAGLIRTDEIKAGRIDHALAFAYQRGRSEFFIPPASTAQATFMEMNNRYGIPMGGRIQLDPDINVDTLKLTPACKIIAKALQEYGAFCSDYAGGTVIFADNSPDALKYWKGILNNADLRKVINGEFLRKHFRVIKMGNQLPGQNLENGDAGFVEFKFPGMLNVSIDWLKSTIECTAGKSVNISKLKPEFKTVRKNSSVLVNGVKQESGNSTVSFSKDIVYKVTNPDGKTKIWTVRIRKE